MKNLRAFLSGFVFIVLLCATNSVMASQLVVCVWCDTNGNGIIDTEDFKFEGGDSFPISVTGEGVEFEENFVGQINSCDQTPGPWGNGLKLLNQDAIYSISLGDELDACVISFDVISYFCCNDYSVDNIASFDQPVYPDFFVDFTNNVVINILLDQSCCLPEEEAPEEVLGDDGCTPGYWKNHKDAWAATGYSPDQSILIPFPEAAAYFDVTMMKALKFGGGPRAKGAAKILLRAAVASLLNASHPDVKFALFEEEIKISVNNALASGDRATMISLARELDDTNNAHCPLN